MHDRIDAESEAMVLAAVFASVPDAVLTSDTDGRIRFINPAAELLFGVESHTVRGGDVVEAFVAPSDRERARDLTARLTAGEQLGRHLLELQRSDGTHFTAEVTASQVADDAGRVLGLVAIARDVTARLASEADAAALRAVVDAAAEAIIGLDERGNVLFFSPSAERLYGYRAEEIIGRPASELAAGPVNTEQIRALLESGAELRQEAVALHRDGTRFEVEISARAILDSDGRIRGSALTVLDISERRRTQRLLDRIVAHAPNAIAVKDLEGRYVLYNNRGTLGMPGESLLGRTDMELYDQPFAREVMEQDREVIERAAPLTFQNDVADRDGRLRSFVSTKFPLLGPDGEVEAVGVIASDVTDLRRGEADSAQLAALVQAAPDAIVARSEDGRIATWNPGAEQMFGLPAEQAIGRDYEDLLVPDADRDAFRKTMAEVAAGRTVTVRAERKRADGSRFPAQIATSPLTLLDGSWRGSLAMIRDITDLVDAELELRERAELLERSNADLERFAYAASHDLQEPLNSIKLSAGAVLEAAGHRLDAEERELMAYIDQSASRLSGQVRGLMEVAQVALGGGASERVPLEVTVYDALDALRAAASAASAEIEVREPLPEINVPRTELSLVLQNVVGNAIKYHRADAPPRIVVSSELEDHCVVVHVADNGVGLTEADLGRIFGIFERASSGVPGTGLGLAVARRMLERHGGSITASSEGPDQGSVFTVRLPLR